MRSTVEKRRGRIAFRRGAAMVEFAICLPVFFLITMGTIETCRMIYLRQSLKLAAYESARVGIIPTVTIDTMKDQCILVLENRKIAGYEFSCNPPNLEDLQMGDLLTVTIAIPAEPNALVGSWFYTKKTISASVSIMAEY